MATNPGYPTHGVTFAQGWRISPGQELDTERHPAARLCRALGLDPNKVNGFSLSTYGGSPPMLTVNVLPQTGDDEDTYEHLLAAAVRTLRLVPENDDDPVTPPAVTQVTEMPGPAEPVTAVWLRRYGDDAEVLVEIDGEWRKVITERYDGQFSHIAEARSFRREPPEPA